MDLFASSCGLMDFPILFTKKVSELNVGYYDAAGNLRDLGGHVIPGAYIDDNGNIRD